MAVRGPEWWPLSGTWLQEAGSELSDFRDIQHRVAKDQLSRQGSLSIFRDVDMARSLSTVSERPSLSHLLARPA